VNHRKSRKDFKPDYEIGSSSEILDEQGLTRIKAAGRLGISLPKLSSMLRGQFSGLSERKLMDCITQLGKDL
jgi:hypothetical protein